MSKGEGMQSTVKEKSKEIIPDYDGLFNEEKKIGNKKNKGFLAKIILMNIKPLALSIFIYLFQVLPVVLVPLCTADIIDTVTIAIEQGITNAQIIRLVLAISVALVSILTNVPTTVLRWRVASKMLRRTSAGIRLAMVKKLQSLSITYHKDMQTGRVQSKFLKDMETFDMFMSTLTNGLTLNIVSLLMFTAIALYRNIYVSLFFVVIIPMNVFLRTAFYKKIRLAHHDYRVNTENMSAKMTGMIEMIPVTKSHGLENVEISTLGSSISRVEKSGRAMDKTNASFGAWAFVVNNGLSVVCLAFCAYMAVIDKMSIGEVILFQSMFTQISGIVSAIVNSLPQIYSGREAVCSLAELMHVNEVEVSLGKQTIPRVKGQVEFENVCYKYPNTDKLVVKNLNFSVNEGECIAIVGPSGSGKSTLINMIIGFLLPTSGEVKIDGRETTSFNLSEYRHHISVVPQNSILFSGTIKENITYGVSDYTKEQLEEVLEMANINEFIKDLPEGINTIVGEHGDKLSGGQRQRISIARALIRKPHILILDEATSALDNLSEYHVQKAISSAVKNRTTFIVAHRLSTIRDADRIIFMDEGECVEMGTYDELMAKKGKFFELKTLNDMTSKKVEQELG